MKLTINGETSEIAGSYDLPALIEHLGLPAQAVLVEHNGAALRRDEWPATGLSDGDHLEIIRIVAGG